MRKMESKTLNKKVKITLEIDKEALELIDKSRKQEFSSRTNFLVRSSVNRARELLGEGN